MKKSKADTIETRKRIVAVASSMIPKLGLAGTGVEDIMKAAGMTLGGFYRHFESKEQLVAEASAAAFAEFRSNSALVAEGKDPRAALDTIVGHYLNQFATNEIVGLCPLATLASELRHASETVKSVADDGYTRMVDMFAAHLEAIGIAEHVQVAESIVTTIVGAVSLSQLATQPSVSKAILENARHTVNVLVDSAAVMTTGQ